MSEVRLKDQTIQTLKVGISVLRVMLRMFVLPLMAAHIDFQVNKLVLVPAQKVSVVSVLMIQKFRLMRISLRL